MEVKADLLILLGALHDSFDSGIRVHIYFVVRGHRLASNNPISILYNAIADSKTVYDNLIIKINIIVVIA